MESFNASFIKSAADQSGFIDSDKPIVCVCGRSNVGKSSFINMLANRKKLAKTSSTPGRTRLVNYFDFGQFILADLPGYGYAEVSRAEKERWAKTLDLFFELTKISLVISLVDIRHPPTADDRTMIDYLYAKKLPFIVAVTKSDKIAKTKIRSEAAKIAAELKLGVGDVIATSAETGLGKDQVIAEIEKAIKVYNGNF